MKVSMLCLRGGFRPGAFTRTFARRLSATLLAAGLSLAATAWSQTAPADAPEPLAGSNTLVPNTMGARTAACIACHGQQGRAGSDGYYPRLAGKPREYLYHQLLNFRDGRRQYRPMAYLLHDLPDAYLREIAGYFSDQHVPYPEPQRTAATPAELERGRLLTTAGDQAHGIPACASCHGAKLSGLAPAIPGLLGLPRDYIGAQIGSWKTGLRHAAAPDCMADVAQHLTPEDIAAVSAWLSAQTVTEPYVPEAAGSIRTSAECGSQVIK
jgi:cytochrome c553